MPKYVYLFSEGNKDQRDLLGGKGANLAEMVNMGLPVPLGFTITTEACKSYYNNNEKLDENIINEVKQTINKLEDVTGKKLGDKEKPLLVSVRSGAPISMPGMMDTILNIGLNDKIAAALATTEDNMHFIYDSYRRLIMMFANVVKNSSRDPFEKYLEELKIKKVVKADADLSAEDMYTLALKYKEIYQQLINEPFPEDPEVQIVEAIKAVFRSWNTERAITYRKINKISEDLGTAVNVQEMVYGNLTDNSFTGVAFSRNPANGIDNLYGEYLEKAQGEDIVSGVRTPKDISAMERDYPNIYKELKDISKLLERHYKDMQDMEFTCENGKLYMLQTRNGKRTTLAALKIAVDLVNEKLITKQEALMRIEPEKLAELLHPSFDNEELQNAHVIATGLPASPGAVSGKIYFTLDALKKAINNGEKTILVREETSAEDIEGMSKADGILTKRGGMTSHAAVVTRGLGKCCISGCSDINVDLKAKEMKINNKTYKEGSEISLDGNTGKVYEGIIKNQDFKIADDFKTYLSWAKEIKKLGVKANAETTIDAKTALEFGAEGIGLARSEHMFFKEDKLLAMQKMIIAKNKDERQTAIDQMEIYQTQDYEQLIKIMDGKVVTVRYLDPPLHEFLPKTPKEIKKLSENLGIKEDVIIEAIELQKEFNPMMGHRGCRLLITYPELAIMQTRAILTAALNAKRQGFHPKVELMIPLIGTNEEYEYIHNIMKKTAKETLKNETIDYKIGTMIELPRSIVIADLLAKKAQFFSFGTNDLTQMTYGFSRDDAEKFLNDYYEKGIFKADPFKTIDKDGVGRLLMVGVRLAKKSNPNIDLGICGEHGGDPASIEFCHQIGLDYVSCSPYRVPIAILSAAQAAIKAKK